MSQMNMPPMFQVEQWLAVKTAEVFVDGASRITPLP
ncbi:unnamed protein product, partial [marine sediment metagenome]